jgi:hypothetical protein
MAKISKLADMRIDEISLVRRPANQHAAIVFSKSDEGDEMPGQVYTEDGQPIDVDDLDVGTIIVDEDGTESVVVPADATDEEVAELWDYLESDDQGEPQAQDDDEYAQQSYGKSADNYADLISKAYTEAVSDDERAELLSVVAKEAHQARSEASSTRGLISKMQQDAVIDECISKAHEYGFAGPRSDEFGLVIAKMMTVLDDEELQLMDDIFKAFSELAEEVAIGTEHAGFSDVLDAAHAHAGEIVKSLDGGVSEEQAFAATFSANPDLYALYLAEKGGN